MKVSIITVNYNNGNLLENTIQSVVCNITNLHEEVEYIVIDGGSTDSSVLIIKKHEQYINSWISEKDGGIYNAMNKGVSIARGDYVLFLNSGDTFYENNILEKILPCLDADFVCGNACLRYADGTGMWIAPQTVNSHFFIQRFSLCHQSLFIRTSLLKARPYDESLKIVADYEEIFYEIVVNHRTYEKLNFIVCYYGCDGVSSNHEKADAEKRFVLSKFRYLGYIDPDELYNLVIKLKVGSRKYRLLLVLAKCIMNIRLWK